jgi:hypothetical protein
LPRGVLATKQTVTTTARRAFAKSFPKDWEGFIALDTNILNMPLATAPRSWERHLGSDFQLACRMEAGGTFEETVFVHLVAGADLIW